MRKKDKNREYTYCWEFQNCLNETKNQCVVFTLGIDQQCWVTNRLKPGNPGIMNGSCMNCPWFKKHTTSS
ncbi:hypothetical protein AYK25_02920 [Thermoplasmatales archaeon SM1-50]|nr:MAG: hypothetical protein AYK25_02920 [Thermoplasmatales archaeon SM1-50]